MSAGIRNIVVRFTGDSSGVAHAAEQGEKAVGKFSTRTQKLATGGLAIAGAGAAALVGTLKAGVEGLLEGAEAEAKFDDALSRSNKAVQAASDGLKDFADETQRKTKFSYEDVLAIGSVIAKQQSLSQVVKNGVAGVEELADVSTDLATVMGVDGTKAAELLGKALGAPDKASGLLKKAGVLLTAGEKEKIKALVESGKVTEAQGIILDRLKAKTEGAAEAAGDTMSGKLTRAQNAFGEMQESLAQGLIPVLQTLSDWGLKISGWLQDNPEKVKIAVIVLGTLAAVIGTVSAAIKLWEVGTKIFTAVQATFNAVLAANPIVLITIAIAALVAGIVIAYKKSDRFRAIVDGLGRTVKRVVGNVVGWFGDIGTAVSNVVSTSADVFGKVADIITTPYRLAFNGIASLWNNTVGKISFKIPGWVPGIGGNGFDVPDIPTFARGGVARRGWTLVGERGPELVNLGSTSRVLNAGDTAAAMGGNTEVHIHATGPTLQDIVRVEIKSVGRAQKLASSAGATRAGVAW